MSAELDRVRKRAEGDLAGAKAQVETLQQQLGQAQTAAAEARANLDAVQRVIRLANEERPIEPGRTDRT